MWLNENGKEKRNKIRVTPFHPPSLGVGSPFLAQMIRLGLDVHQPLFCTAKSFKKNN
jgi:hypothetical protein